MVRLRLGGVTGIALLDRAGNLLADRTTPAAVRVLPGQTILFARSTHDALGILVHLIAITFPECVFLLRFYVAPADLDRVQFVATNTTVKKFLASGVGIEGPLSSLLHKRDWKWPILIA